MNRQNATPKPRSAARARIGAIAAVLGVTLAAAAPASAGDEFGRGFENEMGRIVAHATFGAGLGLLHAVTGPPVVYHQPPAVVVHTRGHGPPHYRHAARHHRHDRHCGHGYYDRHPYKAEHRYKHHAKRHYEKKHYRNHHGKHRRHHRDYDDYDDDYDRRPQRRGRYRDRY